MECIDVLMGLGEQLGIAGTEIENFVNQTLHTTTEAVNTSVRAVENATKQNVDGAAKGSATETTTEEYADKSTMETAGNSLENANVANEDDFDDKGDESESMSKTSMILIGIGIFSIISLMIIIIVLIVLIKRKKTKTE